MSDTATVPTTQMITSVTETRVAAHPGVVVWHNSSSPRPVVSEGDTLALDPFGAEWVVTIPRGATLRVVAGCAPPASQPTGCLGAGHETALEILDGGSYRLDSSVSAWRVRIGRGVNAVADATAGP